MFFLNRHGNESHAMIINMLVLAFPKKQIGSLDSKILEENENWKFF